MPRPGPRPYECVRRSWHSDRHQPMRGVIIQQIFRVVRENHSTNTKKNREWQEKLPLVVLKSEEIMYSKANSEAEYMDQDTLWDRVNDAINTIIRKDDTMETGDFLPPCVEAALNLGCVPIRASRSQRNSNPRSYLSPRAQDSSSIPTKIMDNATNARSTIERPNVANQIHSFSEANRDVRQNYTNAPAPSSLEKFPLPGINQFISNESKTSFSAGSVYPLYYGVHFQPDVPQMSFPASRNSNTIIVGTPIFQAISEPSQKGCSQNLFSYDGVQNASNRIIQSDFRDKHKKEPKSMECDLSLRLGPFSEPCSSRGKCSDVGPSDSQEGGKFSNLSSPQSREFSFFPVVTAKQPLDFCTSGWNLEGEDSELAAARKRKVPVNNNVERGQYFWQSESTSDQITDQIKRRGL